MSLHGDVTCVTSSANGTTIAAIAATSAHTRWRRSIVIAKYIAFVAASVGTTMNGPQSALARATVIELVTRRTNIERRPTFARLARQNANALDAAMKPRTTSVSGHSRTPI